jgi:hypothetical protein
MSAPSLFPAWNPRYSLWARSLGLTESDVPKGGAGNAAFMGWISRAIRLHIADEPDNANFHRDGFKDHARFDAWLVKNYARVGGGA